MGGPIFLPPGDRYPLDENCHHYTKLAQVPWDIQKYWHQRFSIFSFYDWDIHLTDSAWFGVTPEPVATRIAHDLSTHPIAKGKRVLIDLFGGAGGNVIAFALSQEEGEEEKQRWDRIIAIEKDQSTLACAQHNAEVYGVLDRIEWVHGDSFEVMRRFWDFHGQHSGQTEKEPGEEEKDETLDELLEGLNPAECLVFASPPWGGVSYRDQEVFDLSKMEPYNLEQLYEACSSSPSSAATGEGEGQGQKQILPQALFLPRQSDLNQIAALVPDGAPKVDVVQYCQKGASKALVAYLPGNIVASEQKNEKQSERGQKRKHHDEEQEQEQGQEQEEQQEQQQQEQQQPPAPELLPEAPVEEEETSMSHDASFDASFDDSYIQNTSHIDSGTPNTGSKNAEKRKRKRRRRSSHNN
ncbi:RNA cap guanine-N2 methyltransferase-domain-containing protein [Sordaria brevicollis]|uniref:Trimethylguanosine synthase n=1 Tax=Sordaria brevicollis TaxID=83679 RepID=A0AAE0P8Y6_SORBR|nr:RNA cap guanine-N2 methyltransferase-domain-containing protein [Sordaria brevicollis]